MKRLVVMVVAAVLVCTVCATVVLAEGPPVGPTPTLTSPDKQG